MRPRRGAGAIGLSSSDPRARVRLAHSSLYAPWERLFTRGPRWGGARCGGRGDRPPGLFSITTKHPPSLLTVGPLDLRLPRRRHQQHPRLRGRLPRRPRRPARAELPLHADHPRRGQRGHLQQPRPHRRRRCGPSSGRATRSRSASSTTSTPRPASWPARSSGWSTRASRARRSRSSTGPTRSRGCSRTRWCAPRSPTR